MEATRITSNPRSWKLRTLSEEDDDDDHDDKKYRQVLKLIVRPFLRRNVALKS